MRIEAAFLCCRLSLSSVSADRFLPRSPIQHLPAGLYIYTAGGGGGGGQQFRKQVLAGGGRGDFWVCSCVDRVRAHRLGGGGPRGACWASFLSCKRGAITVSASTHRLQPCCLLPKRGPPRACVRSGATRGSAPNCKIDRPHRRLPFSSTLGLVVLSRSGSKLIGGARSLARLLGAGPFGWRHRRLFCRASRRRHQRHQRRPTAPQFPSHRAPPLKCCTRIGGALSLYARAPRLCALSPDDFQLRHPRQAVDILWKNWVVLIYAQPTHSRDSLQITCKHFYMLAVSQWRLQKVALVVDNQNVTLHYNFFNQVALDCQFFFTIWTQEPVGCGSLKVLIFNHKFK